MTGLVQAVAAQLDGRCLVGRLNKEGCNLLLTGLPKTRIAIDLDSPVAPVDTTATHCDYLLLVEDGPADACAAPIELKKGGFSATSVASQLQAGADVLSELVPERRAVWFRALVASGRFPKSERHRFKRAHVRFRGRTHRLFRMACGGQLWSALRR